MTLSELAAKSYSSSSSIHRLIKKIGFDGYSDFKFQINEDINNEAHDKFSLSNDTYLLDLLNDIKITYKLNLNKLDKVAIEISKHKNLYCFGTGWKQQQVAGNFANDLLYYGYSFKTLRNVGDLELAQNNFSKDSLLLIVSLSGDMTEYGHIIKNAKKKGVVIVAVTINSNNSLSQFSDYSLTYVDTFFTEKNNHWPAISLNFILDQLVHHISLNK